MSNVNHWLVMFGHIVMNGKTFLRRYFRSKIYGVIFADKQLIQTTGVPDEPFKFRKPLWSIVKLSPSASE